MEALLTIITEQKVLLDAVDCNRPNIVSLEHKVQAPIRWIKQTLHVQRLQIDNLEPFRTSHTQLCLKEMYRARLGRDVEFLPISKSCTKRPEQVDSP